ncbi:hypothetical protein SAMN04487976_12636 [Xaviernesmea oryzae]|nr:hypothetical protein SAMN04487976_12636 [Xaviernesmea oryzae]
MLLHAKTFIRSLRTRYPMVCHLSHPLPCTAQMNEKAGITLVGPGYSSLDPDILRQRTSRKGSRR